MDVLDYIAPGSHVGLKIRTRNSQTHREAVAATEGADHAASLTNGIRSQWNDFSMTQLLPTTDVSVFRSRQCSDVLYNEDYCVCDISNFKCLDTGERPICNLGSSVPIVTEDGETGFYCATSEDDPVAVDFVSAMGSS